jgi:hypothetical protein
MGAKGISLYRFVMIPDPSDTFLENKLNLQIGNIDDEGNPNIQPVWPIYVNSRCH